jgi:hypothetical protein
LQSCPLEVALPALAVSAEELVLALRRAGFHERRGQGVTILERGHRMAVVPDLPLLAPETLSLILREAGVPFSELLDCLDEMASRDVAESGVRCIEDDEDADDG